MNAVPVAHNGGTILYQGDCRAILPTLVADSVHACVTDPPYDLCAPGARKGSGRSDKPDKGGFMGMSWDATGVAFDPETWRIIARVLRPGGHVLAFGGSRTFHRLMLAIEDAGLEIRDTLMFLHGKGQPKSQDVSKAIDALAGVDRPVLGTEDRRGTYDGRTRSSDAINARWRASEGRLDVRDVATRLVTAPVTPEARRWEDWSSQLKPAFEPIVLARKPLAESSIARQLLASETGALNIGGCRMRTEGAPAGRWPANVLLDEASATLLDQQSGVRRSGKMAAGTRRANRAGWTGATAPLTGRATHGDSGGASRFFYTSKASSRERDAGLPEGMTNDHPTVKPLDLLCWLVRLCCPPGGVVLDPFLGSGTTAIACVQEGMQCIGIEQDAHYLAIARARLAAQEREHSA